MFTSIYANAQQLDWHEERGLSLDAPIELRVQAGIAEVSAGLFILQGARKPAAANGETLAPPSRTLQEQPYTPSLQTA